jgi:hypothetical protein
VGGLFFWHVERQWQRIATPRQNLIDSMQKALPSNLIGNREALKHDQAMKILGKHRIAYIISQPQMERITPPSRSWRHARKPSAVAILDVPRENSSL